MAFWRRKKDEFVSLGLSRAASERAPETQTGTETGIEPQPVMVARVEPAEAAREGPAPSPWQTSVLGLDLSIEQLQAREAALE